MKSMIKFQKTFVPGWYTFTHYFPGPASPYGDVRKRLYGHKGWVAQTWLHSENHLALGSRHQFIAEGDTRHEAVMNALKMVDEAEGIAA